MIRGNMAAASFIICLLFAQISITVAPSPMKGDVNGGQRVMEIKGATINHHVHRDVEHLQPLPDKLVQLESLGRRFDPSLDLATAWSVSGDPATYAGAASIDKVILPVRVNLMFIGFDGSGNADFKLTDEQFAPWFGHIAHALKHYRVPVGEEQTTTSRAKTKALPIEHFLSIQVVRVHPMVEAIISDMLRRGVREETVAACENSARPSVFEHSDDDEDFDRSAREMLSFPADRMGSVVNSLLSALGLNDTYTIVLMNPNRPTDGKRQVYGYREGLSDDEMKYVVSHSSEIGIDLTAEIDEQGRRVRPQAKPCAVDAMPHKLPAEVFRRSTGDGMEVVDMMSRSHTWAKWFLDELRETTEKLEKEGGGGARAVDDDEKQDMEDSAEWAFLTRSGKLNVTEHTSLMYESGTAWEREHLEKIVALSHRTKRSNENLGDSLFGRPADEDVDPAYQTLKHEDCLVDAYTTHERCLWIDLAAGPFEWGPVVTGEGTRTHKTLPRVIEEEMRDVDPVTMGHREEEEQTEKQLEEDEKLRHLMTSAVKYCGDDPDGNPCKLLKDRIKRMSEENQKKREKETLEGSEEEGGGSDSAVDQFLSDLSATITSALRHVFLPSSPLYPAQYSQRVVFHVYVITDHHTYDPLDPLRAFDYASFRHEILKLKLPQQEFSFHMNRIDMADSPSLGAAFHSSLRSLVLPTLSVQGWFSAVTQLSIDSRTLRKSLSSIREVSVKGGWGYRHSGPLKSPSPAPFVMGDDSDVDATGFTTERHVPIFLFSLDHPYPVFVDKYYQAKALSDMVVAVQSPDMESPSRMSCNGKPIFWNLRDPTKHLLAAAALQLGGLVPPHVSYNPARETATQEWMWSTGDSPVSRTSSGHHFTRTQIDAVHRNYIIHALESTINRVNTAVGEMREHRSLRANEAVAKSNVLAELKSRYEKLIDAIDRVARMVGLLDMSAAIEGLQPMDKALRRFEKAVSNLNEMMEEMQCYTANTNVEFREDAVTIDEWVALLMLPVLFIAFDILILILIFACRPKGSKMKTN